MMEALIVLILLHTGDGHLVEVNPEQITSMRSARDRPADAGLFASGARCLINLADGKFIAVIEDCDTVKKMTEGNR